MPVGACAIERFPDGEVAVRLLQSVRRSEAFLVQPTSPPVNDHLVELLALADACRRAGAAGITAIVPYFGYGRADKRHGREEPITGRVVADVMEVVGTRCLDLPLIVLHKRRESGARTVVTHVAGDVWGRACLIVDDMISTGGTVVESVTALLHAGARPAIIVAATHGLLFPGARRKLDQAGVHEVYVTDTISTAEPDWPRLRVVSIAPLITCAVERCLANGSTADRSRGRDSADDRRE